MADNQTTLQPSQVGTRNRGVSEHTEKQQNSTGGASSSTSLNAKEAYERFRKLAVSTNTKATEGAALSKHAVGVTTGATPWKYAGSAESRGTRGYDAGNTNDSLFRGGGSRQVPDGPRRMAGGSGGGGETMMHNKVVVASVVMTIEATAMVKMVMTTERTMLPPAHAVKWRRGMRRR